MHARLRPVVKAYDVRGRVPDQLDPAIARALGEAFADEVGISDGRGRAVVGRDMRASSPEVAGAVADGIRSRGGDVVEIGLASTDMLYCASGVLDVPGVMVTASHNPAADNGLKLCRAGARPIGLSSGLAAMAEAKGVPLAFEAAVAGGIPAIKAVREGLAANRISRVTGILNGTCNYILTQMRERGREFAEVLADAQKLVWKLDPANKGRWIDAGLWSLARYPNYFGEMTLWWGVWLLAVPSFGRTGAWATVAGPLFVALLLLRVSGIPLQEAQARERWGDDAAFKAYVARTRLLVPVPK